MSRTIVTALALGLLAAALLVLAGACIVLMMFAPAFGYMWCTFTAVAIVTAALVATFFRKGDPNSATPRQQWLGHILRWARIAFIGLFACWLGLILWLQLGPGGDPPPAKDDPALVRVITWNIHCGQEEGLPWKQFDWPARKHALKAALEQAKPDILCVQEATPEQVAFLEKALSRHRRVGGGRDGEDEGEHCAIYFDHDRFEELGTRTFWLEEPIDQPRVGGAFDVKRICTWVRLRDRTNGRTMRVYNAHLYLTEPQNVGAVKIILGQMAAGDPADALLFSADFNAKPSASSRQMFTAPGTGLTDSAERAGQPVGVHTFQLYGFGVWCIDGILVDSRWRVRRHHILDVKPHGTYPSDHFAILADMAIK